MLERVFIAVFVPLLVLWLSGFHSAHGQVTKLVVAYSSPAATFCPGWIAKREGLFAKYHLDVDMVLMQGPSTYMPALASGYIPSHRHRQFRLDCGRDRDAIHPVEVDGQSFHQKSNGFERQEAGGRAR